MVPLQRKRTEIGPDFSSCPQLATLLPAADSPQPYNTGGKVDSSKTRPSKNRAGAALRMVPSAFVWAAEGFTASAQTFSPDRLSQGDHAPGIRCNGLRISRAPLTASQSQIRLLGQSR